MSVWIFVAAAALLSIERICYVWIWRAPHLFRRAYPDPIEGLRNLFYAFKLLQGAVFLAWGYVFGEGVIWPSAAGPLPLAIGAGAIVVGQMLNFGVFYRLGHVGVFYGNRFGYDIPWCRDFPFSLFDHPQYFGALLTIWGLFVVMRFPHGDWWVLPGLETVYYVIGARFENR